MFAGVEKEIGDTHALFQPSHGTAPQLAGKDVANPLTTVLSGAMMLDWLGERHNDPAATTDQIRHVVQKTHDARQRYESGLRLLAAGHYQIPESFSDALTPSLRTCSRKFWAISSSVSSIGSASISRR